MRIERILVILVALLGVAIISLEVARIVDAIFTLALLGAGFYLHRRRVRPLKAQLADVRSQNLLLRQQVVSLRTERDAAMMLSTPEESRI